MSSTVFPYICTKQTVDAFVPAAARDLTSFARDVSDAFYATQGGYLTVGKLAFFPLQKAVPFHLLCDGKEVPKASFPELYEYLGDLMGTALDADNFVLPNYIGGTITPAATAVSETVAGGTVTSETPTPGGGNSGGSIDRPVESGGRVRQVLSSL